MKITKKNSKLDRVSWTQCAVNGISVAKIPRVPVENQFTTLSVVKTATKFSPCSAACQYNDMCSQT